MKYAPAVAALLAAGTTFADTVITFDGQSTTGNNTAYVAPPVDGLHNWSDSGVTFRHEVVFGGFGWEGFTYSSVNDTTTTGYGNQYAVYGDGMDYSDAGSYAVFYNSSPATVLLPVETTVQGFYANNTTYAALSMLDGDAFSRQFTTASNDFFTLTIEGFNNAAVSQGTVDFSLADYTGATGMVVDDWTWVDLSGLGTNVSSLAFSFASSDVGAFGINTPQYFAMDNLTVAAIPEPGTVTLMLCGFGGMVLFRRRRKYLMRS